MKKIISFVLLAAMLLALVVPATLAADEVAVSAASPDIMEGGKTIGSALALTSNPGDLNTVSVIVFWEKSATDVEAVSLSFDSEAFDAENTSVGSVYPGNNKNVKNYLAAFGANTADYQACTIDFVANAPIDGNAVLGSVVFTLANATVKGEKFNFSVAVTYACDSAEEDIAFSEDKVDATITILEDPNLGKYTDPTLFVVPEKTEIYESDAGTKMKVDVRVDANPGVWGGGYILVYPNTWTVDSYNNGSIFMDNEFEVGYPDSCVADDAATLLFDRLASYPETPIDGTSYFFAYFQSESEDAVNTNNGVFFSYVFNIPSDMKIGDKADFYIIYDREGDFVRAGEGDTNVNVTFDVVNASVEMIEVKCDHQWGEGAVTTEPTCHSVGVRTFTCPLCKKTKTEEIPMTSHNLTDVVDKATCTTPETTYQKCTNEGCTYKTEAQETATKLGHDLQFVKTVAATCKEGGYDLYKCSRCEYTENQNATEAKPHTPGEPQTVPAKCMEDGHTVVICTECKTVLRDEVIPALGHNMVKDDAQSYAATCTDDGKLVKVCANGCGETSSETLTKLGHDFGEYQQTKAPSCEEAGEKTRYCSRCPATETEAIAALGHDWNEGEVTTEPTCTEKGEKFFECSRCPATKTEEIAANGHSWDEGVVTKEATETTVGEKLYTCPVCGETKTEEIPVVEPEKKPEPKDDDKKEEEKKENNKKEESPKTGDNMVYIVVALVVVLLASAAVIIIRRRKEND